jgi:FtsP/CotA-like multicopper oxidase with cupredoxin domain
MMTPPTSGPSAVGKPREHDFDEPAGETGKEGMAHTSSHPHTRHEVCTVTNRCARSVFHCHKPEHEDRAMTATFRAV